MVPLKKHFVHRSPFCRFFVEKTIFKKIEKLYTMRCEKTAGFAVAAAAGAAAAAIHAA